MPDWYAVRTEAALRANTIEESMESLMSCLIDDQNNQIFWGRSGAILGDSRELSGLDKPTLPYKNQWVAPAKRKYLAKIIPKKASP